MGASLFYEPTKRKRHGIYTAAPSNFMEMLDRAFGSPTPKLDTSALPVLRGMAAIESGHERAIKDLMEGIEKFDEIQVRAEY